MKDSKLCKLTRQKAKVKSVHVTVKYLSLFIQTRLEKVSVTVHSVNVTVKDVPSSMKNNKVTAVVMHTFRGVFSLGGLVLFRFRFLLLSQWPIKNIRWSFKYLKTHRKSNTTKPKAGTLKTAINHSITSEVYVNQNHLKRLPRTKREKSFKSMIYFNRNHLHLNLWHHKEVIGVFRTLLLLITKVNKLFTLN